MLINSLPLVTGPALYSKLAYDTERDLRPVILVARLANIITVHPDLGVNSLKELVEMARKSPGKLNYGTPGAGSMPHFLGEMLAQRMNLKLTHVPFQGGAPLLINLIGDQIGIGIDTPAEFAENLIAPDVRELRRAFLSPRGVDDRHALSRIA